MGVVRRLMFADDRGDVCRVADGVAMLVNAMEGGECCPLVRDGVRHLIAGMLGGTLAEAPERAIEFVEELHASGATTVSPAHEVVAQMRSRSSPLIRSISASTRTRSSSMSSS